MPPRWARSGFVVSGGDGVGGSAEPNWGAREREKLELAVDVDRVHFFDPETGLGVDAE